MLLMVLGCCRSMLIVRLGRVLVRSMIEICRRVVRLVLSMFVMILWLCVVCLVLVVIFLRLL